MAAGGAVAARRPARPRRRVLEQCLGLLGEFADERGITRVLLDLGRLRAELHDGRSARRTLEGAAARAGAIGERAFHDQAIVALHGLVLASGT